MTYPQKSKCDWVQSADRREARAQRVGDDVLRVADEDRPVADPGEPGDVLDHLGVVVRRQRRLALPAVRHRQEAHEVGEPDVRTTLELGVLVPEVVDVPGLVADDDVVEPGLDDLLEDHEVRDEDLVHPPQRLEAVQVVPVGLRREVAGLRREPRARRVDGLARGLQDGRHRVLREPVDLDLGSQPAQLAGDREVAAGVPEPDRRRHVQDPGRPAPRPRPAVAARVVG